MKLAALNIEAAGRVQIVVAGRWSPLLPGAARHAHFEETEFPAGASREERVAYLRDTLLALKKRFGIKKVVFGLDPGMFSYRVIEMPAMGEKDLKGALAFELEKHLPLPPEDYIWRFASSVAPGGAEVRKIFVLAMKAGAADWITEALGDTGLKLAGIRCSFLESLNGLVLKNGKNKNKKMLYAHAGKTESSLAVLEASVPQTIKTCPTAELKDEIKALKKDGAMRVCVSGETAGLLSLEHQSCPQYPAYSLADSGFGGPFMPNGRLRMDFSRAGGTDADGRNYVRALWVMGAISAALYLLTPAVTFYKLKSASDSVRAETASLRSSAREVIDIKREMEDIKRKKDFLTAFQTDCNRQIKALAGLSKVLPSDAWLSGVTIDDKGKVEIKGFASKSAVLISLLGKSELFKNVEFSAPTQTRDGLEKFSIKMDLNNSPSGMENSPMAGMENSLMAGMENSPVHRSRRGRYRSSMGVDN